MRCFLVSLTLGLAVFSGRSQAGDFPFEPIVLSDGVLLINKCNGQNWIMESGAPHPPGMQRSWNQLQLPGFSMHPTGRTAPHGPSGPAMHGPSGPAMHGGPSGPGPGFSAPGFSAPGTPGTGFSGPGFLGHGPNPQGGFHPGFGPTMPPQMGNHGPMTPDLPNGQAMPNRQPGTPQAYQPFPAVTPGMAPPGSYSRNIPMEQMQNFQAPTLPSQNPPASTYGSSPYAVPNVSLPFNATEPITSSESLPVPADVTLPGPASAEPASSEPANSPEQELAPKLPEADKLEKSPRQRRSDSSRSRSDNDNVKEDGGSEGDDEQPLVMVVASDSEIDLDEVLVLRLSAVTPKAKDAVKAKISVDFPADGKLVRGGNPSSISDDGKDDTNSVTMGHDGNKPLDLVFRFAKPGKKPITIAVEVLGQKTTATFNVMVEEDDQDDEDNKDDDDDKSSKEKKPTTGESKKKDSHKKK